MRVFVRCLCSLGKMEMLKVLVYLTVLDQWELGSCLNLCLGEKIPESTLAEFGSK